MKGRKGGRMMNDAPRETPRQPNNCWTARHVAYARTAWQRTDYTLDEVGVMCDVQAQTVAKWLNVRLDGTPLSTPPRNGPNGIGFVKFAHALGVTPDELMHANLTDFAPSHRRTSHLSIDAPLTMGAGVGSDTSGLLAMEGWLQRLVAAAVREGVRAATAQAPASHDDGEDRSEE